MDGIVRWDASQVSDVLAIVSVRIYSSDYCRPCSRSLYAHKEYSSALQRSGYTTDIQEIYAVQKVRRRAHLWSGFVAIALRRLMLPSSSRCPNHCRSLGVRGQMGSLAGRRTLDEKRAKVRGHLNFLVESRTNEVFYRGFPSRKSDRDPSRSASASHGTGPQRRAKGNIKRDL